MAAKPNHASLLRCRWPPDTVFAPAVALRVTPPPPQQHTLSKHMLCKVENCHMHGSRSAADVLPRDCLPLPSGLLGPLRVHSS